MLITPALQREMQKDQEFKTILVHILRLKPVGPARDSALKKKKSTMPSTI